MAEAETAFGGAAFDEIRTFIRRLARRHPELARPITWPEFTAIARREGILVHVGPLSRPARLLRFGREYSIRISEALDRTARTRFGMHELAHYWRDSIGEPCYYADDEWLPSPSEDFAELFAWVTTYPGDLPGLR